jgi:hypothetical protein
LEFTWKSKTYNRRVSMAVLIFKNFLDKDTCNQLNDWVDLGVEKKWLDKGASPGDTWENYKRLTTRNYQDRFNYPQLVYDVSNSITKQLNIADLSKSIVGGGKDGIVVSYMLAGGDTTFHTDPKENNDLEILRCNILTRKPDNGGVLVIGTRKIELEVGDLHCYLPSTISHYVTETSGNTPRVLWMFGYQCSVERFNNIILDNQNEHARTI